MSNEQKSLSDVLVQAIKIIRLFMKCGHIVLTVFTVIFLFILLMVMVFPFSNSEAVEDAVSEKTLLEYVNVGNAFGYDWELLLTKDTVFYDNDVIKTTPLKSMLQLTTIKETIRIKKKNSDGSWSTSYKYYYYSGNDIYKKLIDYYRDKDETEISIEYNAASISEAIQQLPTSYEIITDTNKVKKHRKYAISFATKEEITEKYFTDDDDVDKFNINYDSHIMYAYIFGLSDTASEADASRKLIYSLQDATRVAAKGKMMLPVNRALSSITSNYGPRPAPKAGASTYHGGIDIAKPLGTEIRAVNSGKIIIAERGTKRGNYVVIDHGGGVATLYAHCSTLLVRSGEEVKKGQVIAKVGSTGVSTGPHLHFEVIVKGTAVEPTAYLR